MIGKVISPRKDGKSSFFALVRYIAGAGHGDKCNYINTRNLSLVEDFPGLETTQNFIALVATEMESTAVQNKRIQEPAFHIVLSWPFNENPNQAQVEEAIDIITKNLNLDEAQCVYGLHKDTEHVHLHVAFNRVHPETYAAIQPANRWTKKALEKATREIELAQGWGRELNGKHYTIISEQVIAVAVDKKEREKPIIQKARDYEAHTGESSAQTKIRDIVTSSFMQNLSSWEKFHEALKNENITYCKKGSGAVFVLDNQEVKASNISKKLTLAQLMKKFGEYKEIPDSVQSENKKIQPKEQNKNIGVVTKKEEKTEKELWTELRKKQSQEFTELKAIQKLNRTETFSGSWKGRGVERNFIQSVMAVAMAKERRDLLDQHAQERKNLREQLNRSRCSKKKYIRNAVTAIKEGQEEKKSIGIFALETVKIAGGVGYRKKDKDKPLLVDTGLSIRTTIVTKEAVLATLQLAAAKWGGCEIHGSKKYKELCIDIAAQNGIKITNLELQETVAKAHRAEKKKRGEESNDKSRTRGNDGTLRSGTEPTRQPRLRRAGRGSGGRGRN